MSPTDDILRRLRRVRDGRPRNDRTRAEAALHRHFAALGMPAPHIRWIPDLPSARAAVANALPCTQWEVVERLVTGRGGGFRPIVPFALTQPPFSRAMGSAWSDQEERVLHLTRAPELSLVGRGAAVVAAYSVSARLEARERSAALLELLDAFEAGLWMFWPLREAVVALARPVVFEDGGRFHCEHGPAIAWEDGFKAWFWKGVRVPAHVVERPASITLREIEGEENVERRRILLERYGHERFLRDVGAQPVLKDACGELYRVPVGHGLPPLAMVAVLNATPEPDGSRKTCFLRVPPRVESPREAVAWTFGLPARDYAPRVET